MEENKTLAVFENKQIRRNYDNETEVWYFSLVDIVEALTESINPTDYLKKIRKRDPELHLYLGTNCPQVAMLTNGKKRKTLAGNAQHIFRLIQSIPSPKAEPFKQWLAKVGLLAQHYLRPRAKWQLGAEAGLLALGGWRLKAPAALSASACNSAHYNEARDLAPKIF